MLVWAEPYALTVVKNPKAKKCSGSKRRAFRKFGVFDDDLDLAHRFLKTVRQMKTLGVLIVFDEHVVECLEKLLDENMVEKIAVVHLKFPQGDKIEFEELIEHAHFGYCTVLTRPHLLKYIPSRDVEEVSLVGEIAVARRKLRPAHLVAFSRTPLKAVY